MSLKIWLQKVYNSSLSNHTIGSFEENLKECICRTNYRGSFQFRIIKYSAYNNDERLMLNLLDEIKEEDDIDDDYLIPLMNVPIVYTLSSDVLETDVFEIKLYELDDFVPYNKYYLSDV